MFPPRHHLGDKIPDSRRGCPLAFHELGNDSDMLRKPTPGTLAGGRNRPITGASMTRDFKILSVAALVLAAGCSTESLSR